MSGILGIGGGGDTEFYPYTLDQSVRFNDNDSAYLTRTPSSDENLDNWTFSAWTKLANADNGRYLIGASIATSKWFHIAVNTSGQIDIRQFNSSSYDFRKISDAVLRDVSAWYHIVVSYDSDDATAEDRIKVYVNGERITSFGTNENPSSGTDSYLNQNHAHTIGAFVNNNGSSVSNFYDGYLAEVNLVDGTTLLPTSFGETKAGIWVPIEYTGSYGTNGFKLAFQDSAALGDDTSGNGNDFTATNLAASDQMLDTPTNSFSTLNPLLFNTTPTLQEGNLEASLTSSTGQSGRSRLGSTFSVTSGKWYWELTLPGTGDYVGFGISRSGFRYMLHTDPTEGVGFASFQTQATAAVTYYAKDGTGSTATTTTGPTVTDIIQIALDADDGKMWIGDGTDWYSGDGSGDITGTSGDPAAGTNASFTGLDFSEAWTPMIEMTGSNETESFLINFGQDSSFTGTETAQGNTDSNGKGDFYYAPPSGFLALCAANLPDPGIDPNADETPGDYFNTVLYTGDGTTDRDITGFGFNPDFNWLKARSIGDNHVITDVLRGTNHLHTNTTDADSDLSYPALTTDGFTVSGGTYNNSGVTFVSWGWKAGGTAVSNGDGTITSSVSASPESGFSIVSYTGNNTAGATIGHGLGKAPSMIIVKNRTTGYSYGWNVYHAEVGATKGLSLDTDATPSTLTSLWNDTAPTSSVFTVGGIVSNNRSGNEFVAYCFADIDGMVKAGSYTGNGSSDGPFVYTGFRPAWVMIKRTDVANNWVIFDAVRNTFNIADARLDADLPDIESTGGSIGLHLVSNGFQINATANLYDASGGTYIYLAFAEQPFKYANAR